MLKDAFDVIVQAHGALTREIEDLVDRQAALTQAGMWPAACREEWQRRGETEARYLYMVFGKCSSGRYAGPDGRQKVYVGCDASACLQAQAMVRRRDQWADLERKRSAACSVRSGLETRVTGVLLYAESVLANDRDAGLREFGTALSL